MEFYKTVRMLDRVHHPTTMWFSVGELRPGNIVNGLEIGYYKPNAHFLIVTGYKKKELQVEPFPFPKEQRGDLMAIESLIIDDYWLEKFGFEKIEHKEEWRNIYQIEIAGNVILELEEGMKEYWVRIMEDGKEKEEEIFPAPHEKIPSHIKYVEELQNLYYHQAGKELTSGWGLKDLLERIDNLDYEEITPFCKKVKSEFGFTDPADIDAIIKHVSRRRQETWFDAGFREWMEEEGGY